MLKIKFVDDVSIWYKRFSQWCMASCLSLLGVWSMLPDEIKLKLPEDLPMYLGMVLLVLGMFGREVKQDIKPKE